MNEFKTWWWNTGSGIRQIEGHDHEQHAERICGLFWDHIEKRIEERIEDRLSDINDVIWNERN